MSFDLVKLRAYREATDPKVKRRLQGELYTENLALIRKLVTKWRGRHVMRQGDNLDDQMQQGALAFLRALDLYNPERGEFSTYLGHWINDKAPKDTAHSEVVQYPRGAAMPRALRQKMEAIEETEGRPATAEEIGCKPRELENWRKGLPSILHYDAGPHYTTGSTNTNAIGTGVHSEENAGIANLPSDEAGADVQLDKLRSEAAIREAVKRVLTDEEQAFLADTLDETPYSVMAQKYGRSQPELKLWRKRIIFALEMDLRDRQEELDG